MVFIELSIFASLVTYLDFISDNFLIVYIGFWWDFSPDHDHTGFGKSFTSNFCPGILGQMSIKDGIRNLNWNSDCGSTDKWNPDIPDRKFCLGDLRQQIRKWIEKSLTWWFLKNKTFFKKIQRMNPPGIKGCLYNFLTDVKISRQGHSFFLNLLLRK